ncbi:MAG: PLDc N-terminal domain-containing protein, partial [Oscillospiraceae bacterium]|nr:PLDc N-terminal domain-containing protein [Oscillospiraceae bacterium]
MTKFLRKLRELLFSRAIIISLLLVAQILLFLLFIIRLSQYFAVMYGFFVIVSALVALHIITNDSNPAYKLAWIIPVLIFPLFGGMLYLFFGADKRGPKIEQRICDEERTFKLKSIPRPGRIDDLPQRLQIQSEYISRAGYPAYANTKSEFLESGERKFEEMLKAIKSAEKYIFLEYFIIGEGYMWDSIHALLKEKAAQGVDVRVIY